MFDNDFKLGSNCNSSERQCGSGVYSYCKPKDTPCYVNDIKFAPIGTYNISATDRISLDGKNEFVFLRNGTNLPFT